jgi:hypothetical protein
VLVLGHSLHDNFLVQALREYVPPERLALSQPIASVIARSASPL